MGLFDIFKKATNPYFSAENEGLRAISQRFGRSNEDTVFITTSRICPECSKYNRRIFSLFGRYKAFPRLPQFLTRSKCPLCGIHIGYAHYFPGINGNLKKDIAFNKKPICDMRTKEELALWNNFENKQRINKRLEQDFNWLKNNLPDKAPKSLGGYKRMYNTKSANFKKLEELADKSGYTLLS